LKLTFAADVEPRRLQVHAPERLLVDLLVSEPGEFPLNLDLEPGTRLVASFEGRRFPGDPIAGSRPFAALVVVVP